MKVFVTGFLLLIIVLSTLGDALPHLRPLEDDPRPLREDAQHGRSHTSIGRYNIGSCQIQYVNCLINSRDNAQSYKCYWDSIFCDGPFFYTETFDDCCEADGRSFYCPLKPGDMHSRCFSNAYCDWEPPSAE